VPELSWWCLRYLRLLKNRLALDLSLEEEEMSHMMTGVFK